MHPPNELGRKLSTHHPVRPTWSFAACCVPGVMIGAGLWLGATDSWAVGVLAFVVMTVLVVYFLSDSLFVRQQLFEHGLLLSSVVPLTPRYAIPYATIDPETVIAVPFQGSWGFGDISRNRRFRQAPFVHSVGFTGLPPRLAGRLARRREDWRLLSSASGPRAVPGLDSQEHQSEQWFVSFRDNRAAAEALRARAGHGHGHPR